MLFWELFEIGGDSLVNSIANFIMPIYCFICDMADAFGGSWDVLATALEAILS